jgi:phosphatidylglycerophosphate synthase
MTASTEDALEPSPEIERRPLASRSWRFSNALAGALARLGASPNAISTAGLGAGVAGGAMLWLTSLDVLPWLFWLLAAGLVQLRLLCNLIDGMVAVASGRRSPLGELYNEIPDRISDGATLVGLGYAAGGIPWLGYVAALLAVFVAYVRSAVKIAGAPQDYRGPMAKPHRMFVVTVTALTCALVPVRLQLGWTGRDWGLPAAALGLIAAGCVVTAARRLSRAASILKAGTP